MKKIIAVLIGVCLAFSLVTCGGGDEESAETSTSTAASSESSTEQASEPAEEKAPVTVAGYNVQELPVMNEPQTERIGTSGRITILEAEPDDKLLTQICNDLDGLDYNWFTVDCAASDGKGICFYGGMAIAGEYGTLTEDGSVENAEKIVTVKDSVYTLEDIEPDTEAENNTNAGAGTIEQSAALDTAKNYLSFSAFSHDGLVDQLEYEGYSNEDAVFAADNCGADWKEQALKSAESYLDFTAFSYTGLIKQLEHEKYTTEQATYGADNCGADWDEQAVKSAKSYMDYSSFSRDELISQLEHEGFTHEQAVHGVEENGY